MRVSLSNLPSPPKEYTVDFPRLDGGLNNWELDYRLNNNESPEMENLIWKDGALCCRDGQTRLTGETPGTGWSAYERLYWGNGFFHIGDAIYRMEPDTDAEPETLSYVKVLEGVPENAGTWFVYDSDLYYKNRGGYFRIRRTEDGFTAGAVEAYSPIIQINTEPATGAGDSYQPENRLNPQKTVWYSTVEGAKVYQLPVKGVGSVDRVLVDEVDTTAYTVDLEAGTVTFETEPEHHNPVRANTVKITYTKANPEAYSSIMDCVYAAAFGGDQNLCIVMGGCHAQPNAYFWNGNNHIEMHPGYFPVEQYNFGGATEEAITGFGIQQAMLVVFKERSVGRAAFGTTEMDNGRVLITMDYTNINNRIGCDLPGSIRLVENNLVFANTEQGVHMVKDSSSAYENNIILLSRKVNNTLLPCLRKAEVVSSFDDGDRYWLTADGEVYLWDYSLSAYKDPSWFYFTAIKGISFLAEADNKYHLGKDGHLTAFRRNYLDYGEAIHKVYRFATQNMGGYSRLKDVLQAILVVRGDTDTNIRVFYGTDYEVREDLTPIQSYNWSLVPRNLARRFLRRQTLPTVAHRRPGCRHVRHFYMRLESSEPAADMSVISAQIFYRYTGRDR